MRPAAYLDPAPPQQQRLVSDDMRKQALLPSASVQACKQQPSRRHEACAWQADAAPRH